MEGLRRLVEWLNFRHKYPLKNCMKTGLGKKYIILYYIHTNLVPVNLMPAVPNYIQKNAMQGKYTFFLYYWSNA